MNRVLPEVYDSPMEYNVFCKENELLPEDWEYAYEEYLEEYYNNIGLTKQ